MPPSLILSLDLSLCLRLLPLLQGMTLLTQEKEKEKEKEQERVREKDRSAELTAQAGARAGALSSSSRGGRAAMSVIPTPHKPTGKQKEIVGQLHGSQYLAGPRDRLSTFALDSRRKHLGSQSQSQGGGTGTGTGTGDEGSGSVGYGAAAAAAAFSSSSAVSATAAGAGAAAGGSVKRERADLVKEIFR
jgi:hypothetical protein